MQINPIILLTCCVDPKDMIMTALTDKEQRKQQYYEAFDYYLKETDCRIVIVENTGFIIDSKYLNNSRIEYLTFEGNNFDKTKGKGYGELLILEYALKNSKTIKLSINAPIIKVTGRLKILSILQHLKQLRKAKNPGVFADLNINFRFAFSYFFVADTLFFEKYFFNYRDILNDTEGFYFEHALAEATKNYISDGNFFTHLLNPIDVYGYSGTTGQHYVVDKGLIKTLKIKIKYLYFKGKYIL